MENQSKPKRAGRLWRALAVFCLLQPLAATAADLVPFGDITPAQAAALIAEKDEDPLFILLDVRSATEFSENRIKGALNIDVKAVDFKEKVEKLDKNGIYLAYCKGGVRSARAMNLMKEWGFREVYNLAGGLTGWQAEKLPLQTEAPPTANAPAPQVVRVRGPNPGTYHWLQGKKSTTVPFRLARNHVCIAVQVNGGKKLELILDTGMPAAGVLLLGGEAVRELDLAYAGQARIGGVGGGTTPARIAPGVSLRIGDLELREQTAIVRTDDPAEAAPADKNLDAHGIIGFALFGRFVVAIDYDRMLITLSEPGDFAYRGKGSRLPLEFVSNFPFVDCMARLADGKDVPLKMIVDLGASHALALNVGSQPDLQMPARTIPFWGRGATGEVGGQLGRIKSLTLGNFVLNDLLSGFNAVKLMPLQKDGNLGNDALRRFNLIFDYSRQTLIVEPNRGFARPFEADMSGFQAERNRAGELIVRHVLPASPAAEAGLQENDRIVAVNGRPAATLAPDDLQNAASGEGKKLELVIGRGDVHLTVALTLRRLI
jgi:rhodanese-related sulfurtransferase